jgi:dolichol-phosphate mannosyltransferase
MGAAEGMSEREPLDVVIAAHNEVGSIEALIDEVLLHAAPLVEPRLVICEDGSTDGTPDLLRRLAALRPIALLSSPERRGYAAAMIAGLREARTPWILTLDGDGQCAPEGFALLWSARHRTDIVRGVRRPRQDPSARLLMSKAFGTLHRALFQTSLADPSSPFVLMRRAAVRPLLERLGTLPNGFWWEFAARAQRERLRSVDVVVPHRPRLGGSSRAFPWRAVPAIAVTHAMGLVRVWRQGP